MTELLLEHSRHARYNTNTALFRARGFSVITIIKRYTNLRPEENIAIRYVQVSAELAATLAVLLLQFLLVGHRRPPDIVGMLWNRGEETSTIIKYLVYSLIIRVCSVTDYLANRIRERENISSKLL